jgi:hypothetical protein
MMHRRGFLRRLGGSVAGAAGLIPLIEGQSRGAAGPPKRLVVFYTPHGMTGRYPDPFAPIPGPSGRPDDFGWSPILAPLSGGYTEHGLSIDDLRDQVIVTQGIDMVGAGDDSGSHGTGTSIMLTAAVQPQGFGGGGISIDQRIAGHVGSDTRFRSLQLAVQGRTGDAWHDIAYRGPGQALPNESDPAAAFDRLFGFLFEDARVRAARRARKLSILDGVRDDLARLRARVASADRFKLDAHLEALRALERRLDETPPSACQAPWDPSAAVSGSHFAEAGRLHLDLIAAALRCDLTRVVTLMWGTNTHQHRFQWLPGREDNLWPMHEATHDDPSRDETHDLLMDVARFYVRQFAYLAQQLRNTPEGDGTMLDHTQLLWVSETSNPYHHSFVNMPFVLAGGGAGFRTGRFLRFRNAPHSALYAALAQGFGLEIETFGDPAWAAPALGELF